MRFFRSPPDKKAREVDLTAAAFRRWLRAGRPDFLWFLGQSEDVQETLAGLGDAWVKDLVVAVGYAVRDPELAEAGIAGDAEADEIIARRAAQAAVAKILGARSAAHQTRQDAPGSRVEREAPTFAGLSERAAVGQPNGPVRRLLGKEASA